MLRWILLIPFACLFAMGAGVFFLGMASFASPAVAMLIGGGIERLIDILFGLAESGIDPAPAAQAAFALIGKLGMAIIVAPVVLVAVGSELFRLRSGLLQSGFTGLLAALLPLAMLRLSRAPTGECAGYSALASDCTCWWSPVRAWRYWPSCPRRCAARVLFSLA